MKSGVGRAVRGERVFGPEMHEDPHRVYRELRDSDPVYWDESVKGWIVTRYDDVALALNDSRFSSRRVAAAPESIKTGPFRPLLEVMGNKMSEQDEPDHKRLRSLANAAFARLALDHWEPRFRQLTHSLVDGCRTSGKLEFIGEFAVPLPLLTIMELVGVPHSDRVQVKQWCDDFAFFALNYYAHITPEQVRAAHLRRRCAGRGE